MKPKESLLALQKVIQTTAAACLRPQNSVRILAVSKGQSAEFIAELYNAGQRAFGENKVQEALQKQHLLQEYAIEWHFIGPIQRNKTALIAANFSWVHSLDRELIAQRLNDQRPKTLPPLNVCLQINLDNEPLKAGISTQELPAFAALIQTLPNLRLRGLMCIPKPCFDPTEQYQSFLRLTNLQQELIANGYTLDTLSMGMSADFHAAIRAGSTLIRIGKSLTSF